MAPTLFRGVEVPFIAAMRHFFQPNNVTLFHQEMEKLTQKDCEEFRQMLMKNGYNVTSLMLLANPYPKAAEDDGPRYLEGEPEVKITDCCEVNGYRVGDEHPAVMAA